MQHFVMQKKRYWMCDIYQFVQKQYFVTMSNFLD